MHRSAPHPLRRLPALLRGVPFLLFVCALPEAACTATAAEDALNTVLAAPERSDAVRARDASRHPAETLRFFGLDADQTVVELWPELGWYAQILAPYARLTGGTYRAVIWIPPGRRAPAWVERSAVVLQTRADAETHTFEGMQLTGYQTGMDAPLAPLPLEDIAPPGTADLVLSFRDAHVWLAEGMLDAMLEAAFRALAPGGVFGIVAHRAPDDWNLERMVTHGYVSEALLVERARAVGFEPDGVSQINANPADDHDHPAGVWTLPPVLRLGEVDRDRYQATGEPDRLTLRLVKPGGRTTKALPAPERTAPAR